MSSRKDRRIRELEETLRSQLLLAWSDLSEARRRAINGEWSIKCDNWVDQIKAMTKLVGPVSWEEIPIDLLEVGIYQRVHADMGVVVEPDMEQVAEVRRRSDERLSNLRRR